MLGFTSSRGEVVKGKFAELLRKALFCKSHEEQSKEDEERLAFESNDSKIVLTEV